MFFLDDGGGVGGNLGPEVSGFLSDGSSDGGALHFTLGVDDDTGVVLEVDHNAIGTAPLLTLTDDAGEMDFLTELGLTFLDSCEDEITGGGLGEAVQAGSPSLDGHDVKVLGCLVNKKRMKNMCD